MAKVLVVIARPKSDKSRTLKVLNAFLAEYVKTHPDDEIDKLDLYQVDFPEIDGDVLSAWDELTSGTRFGDLTSAQQVKVAEFNASTDQFLAADKIVIANPLINLMVPTKLKAWIDTICVAGKTFKYTDTGAAIPQPVAKRRCTFRRPVGNIIIKILGPNMLKVS